MSEKYNQKIAQQKERKITLIEQFHKEYGRLPKLQEVYNETAIGLFLGNIKQGHTQITEEQLKRLVALGFDITTKDVEAEKMRKIRLVEEFYREFERLPKAKEKYREMALGLFLNNIRRGDTRITGEQLKKLEALGFDITTKDREEEKMQKIGLIEEFYREYGRLPKYEEKYREMALGLFLNNIRRGDTRITEEQLQRLIALGFDITTKDVEAEKMRKIRLVEEFYREYGRLPKTIEKYKEVAIGTFLHHIRRGDTRITEEQLKRLEALGFEIKKTTKDVEAEKMRKIRLIEEFYREFERLPKVVEEYKGEKIGVFLNNIRRGDTRITGEQLKKLEALGFDIKVKDREEEKENKIRLVEEFYKEFRRLPKTNEKYREVAIGMFLYNIKLGNTHITEEQLKRLEALGFDIKVKDREEEKENKIRLVEEFYKEFRRLPKTNEKYKEVAIGMFLYNIRQGCTGITEEQLKRLVSLGFDITTKYIESIKEMKIRLVEEFYEEYGRLPKQIENYKEVAIGIFLSNVKYGNTQITKEQMMRLKKIRFEGPMNNMTVERNIQKIEQFYEKTGRIPTQDETLGKRKIGEMLLQIRIGKVRITESQFLRLQQMDATLTREQVRFFEKPKTLVKK